MSWRVLILILLLSAGAATFGGVQLGDWLVARAPVAAPAPNATGNDSDVVVLDADGKPYLAQPPQPLVNGALGVPEALAPVIWDEPKVSLLIVNTNPNVWVSASKMSDGEMHHIVQASDMLPDGPADVVAADVPAPGQGSRLTPIDAPPLLVQAATPVVSGDGNWQKTLRDELALCARLGFFERPSCAWGARNRYCEANQGWGAIPECPRRSE